MYIGYILYNRIQYYNLNNLEINPNKIINFILPEKTLDVNCYVGFI